MHASGRQSKVIAHPSYDMWGFGMILFEMFLRQVLSTVSSEESVLRVQDVDMTQARSRRFFLVHEKNTLR